MSHNGTFQLDITKQFNISSYKENVFCTIHAGQNKLTNITIKSVLKFHPKAKIFVIDVTSEKSWLREKFYPIDNDVIDNIAVISGKKREEIILPKVDISNWRMKETTRNQIMGDKVPWLLNGDTHHSINIQFAIDTIGENFILLDSDAPLIKKIDFFNCPEITVADIESINCGTMLQQMISSVVFRFIPYVQYMNVSYMKTHGIKYWDQNQVLIDSNCAFLINDSKLGFGLYFPTGSCLFNQVIQGKHPFRRIDNSRYVDHLKAGTWNSDWRKKREFFSKYIYLFSNKKPFGDCKHTVNEVK